MSNFNDPSAKGIPYDSGSAQIAIWKKESNYQNVLKNHPPKQDWFGISITTVVFVCCLIALLTLISSCTSLSYTVNCYDKDLTLVYREHKKYLFHVHDTTQYHTCEIIRDGRVQ